MSSLFINYSKNLNNVGKFPGKPLSGINPLFIKIPQVSETAQLSNLCTRGTYMHFKDFFEPEG